MSFYPPKLQARFGSPQNKGGVLDANASGRSASFECGSSVTFTLKVDPWSRAVVAARFQSNGCGYMVAAADYLAETLKGKTLRDLHGFQRSELTAYIAEEFGPFPEVRHQCLNVCLEALRAAFADLRARQIEEFQGEKALICTCFGVSEETIETHLRAGLVTTVDDVTRVCNAGGGCGSCRILIQEMIDVRGGIA